jgi:2-polyprenyl-6-methoxyphenol hydroxylase-like FAD-dependent oxidoreductase
MGGVRVGIVGGSIAGCTAAACLLRAGFDAVVLERSAHRLEERGAGIWLPATLGETLRNAGLIDRDLRTPSARAREWRLPDGTSRYGRLAFEQAVSTEMHHWGLLLGNLRRRVPDEHYRTGAAVAGLALGRDGASVTLTDGSVLDFDLLVGADGYRSAMRRQLFPEVEPAYAGYPAWRGIIDESVVDDVAPVEGMVQMVGVPRGHAGFYIVPGQNGDMTPGKRRLNWLIYDGGASPAVAGRDDLGRVVLDAVPPGSLSPEQLAYLGDLARRHFPPWHRDVILSTPDPYMQNIYDLALDRYVRGRVCLIGDAATIARPHTGSGAAKAMQDALALADALSTGGSLEDGLRSFQEQRAPAGNGLVRLGQDLGQEQVLGAPDWRQLDHAGFDQLLNAGASSRTYMFVRAPQP